MGLLQLLNRPQLGTTVGLITSITNVKEPGSQGMTWNYTNQNGVIQASRAYTNTLRVETNSPFVGPIQIQQTLIQVGCVQGAYYRFPLPEYNGDPATPASPTEWDTGSFLHDIDFSQESEDVRLWLCKLSYGPLDIGHEIGVENAAIGVSNPLSMPLQIEWIPATFEESYPEDVFGKPFLNSAGDPLEDAPKRTVSRQVLSIVRNEAQYNDSYAQKFRQKVNKNVFLGFEPNQVKCANISGKKIHNADYGYFWEVSYAFEMKTISFEVPSTYDATLELAGVPSTAQKRTYGWEDLITDAGFFGYNASGEKVPLLYQGQPVSSPIQLFHGLQYYTGIKSVDTALPPPPPLVFMQYDQIDFGDLNIPDDILTANQ